MKTIKLLVAMLFAFTTFHTANAQSNKTQNIKVYGECVMCKKRIEKAASSVEGVQSVIWDENTKILTLTYNQLKKQVPENVQKKIALIGHNTELYTATDAAYNSLPDCCHYTRKPIKR